MRFVVLAILITLCVSVALAQNWNGKKKAKTLTQTTFLNKDCKPGGTDDKERSWTVGKCYKTSATSSKMWNCNIKAGTYTIDSFEDTDCKVSATDDKVQTGKLDDCKKDPKGSTVKYTCA